MQVIVIPAGWFWRVDRAIKREQASIEADRLELDHDWLMDDSPERTILVVDSGDLLNEVVTAAIASARPAVRGRRKLSA
jgi:hypothetical protein